MAVPLRSGFYISCSNGVGLGKAMPMSGPSSSDFSFWKNEFKGKQMALRDQTGSESWASRDRADPSVQAHVTVCVPRSLRWWEKSTQPNMVEINSAQELVDSLSAAGDKLVVVDFYSPGCGGCKALHPKVCQFAESNPDALFLKVNYEEHKSMCYSLNIHVLPFFRLYRGAQGRMCSFSCTNATIKKFKDALAKHGSERCSLGPARGLEESELLKLASNREVHLDYHPWKKISAEVDDDDLAPADFAGVSFGTTEVGDEMTRLAV